MRWRNDLSFIPETKMVPEMSIYDVLLDYIYLIMVMFDGLMRYGLQRYGICLVYCIHLHLLWAEFGMWKSLIITAQPAF